MSVVGVKHDRLRGSIGFLILAVEESAFLTNTGLGVLKNALSVSATFVKLAHITFTLMAIFFTYEGASAFRAIVFDLAIVSPLSEIIFDMSVTPY